MVTRKIKHKKADGTIVELDIGVKAVNIDGIVPIEHGGTGASTSADARKKLAILKGVVVGNTSSETVTGGWYKAITIPAFSSGWGTYAIRLLIAPANYVNLSFQPYVVDLKLMSSGTANSANQRVFVLRGDESHLDKLYIVQKEDEHSPIEIWYHNTSQYSQISIQVISAVSRALADTLIDDITINDTDPRTAKSNYTSGYTAHSFEDLMYFTPVPESSKWSNSRTITLAGDLTGSVSFDGSANVTLTATVKDDSHNHTIANIDGLQTALNGKLATTGTAAKAASDALGQNIADTYIKSLSVNGKTITYTRGDGGTGTITTQDTNTDTKATQTNTTTNADYRVVLSTNANDTTETNTLRKSTNFKANPSTGAFYAKGYDRVDITGQTININNYNLSAGSPEIIRFIEKTNGGAANITNIPVADAPFILDVELIRWASATDYVTMQTFRSINQKTYEYVRYCTSGTWSSWTTRVFTDTKYSNMTAATASAAGKAGLVPAPAAGAQGKFLRGDGTWQTPTNTTYSNMTGATSSAAGKAGLVPAPAKGAANRYLRSDGIWAVPPDTNTTYTLSSFGITATAAELNKLDGLATTKTELGYLDGVTGNVQTQLNGKAASSHTHNYAGASSAGGAANSATKLATARTINGTSFNGTANITTANWGTSRAIKIGNTSKNVNGSAGVTWTLAEIGAAPSSHTSASGWHVAIQESAPATSRLWAW